MKTEKLIINSVGFLAPLLLSVLLSSLLNFNYNQVCDGNFYTIITASASLFAGYGFSAGFVLLALPISSNYLQKLNNHKVLIKIVMIMFLTSIYGSLSVLVLFLIQQTSHLLEMNQWVRLEIILFLSTVFQFIWSFIFLCAIFIKK